MRVINIVWCRTLKRKHISSRIDAYYCSDLHVHYTIHNVQRYSEVCTYGMHITDFPAVRVPVKKIVPPLLPSQTQTLPLSLYVNLE